MALKSRTKAVWAELEASYGVAETLVAADAVQTKSDIEIMPLEGGTVDRDLARPSFGADLQIHVGVHVKIRFKVELVGSGTLGTAPAYADLLLACGMEETVVASTSVEYTPDSASTNSVTIGFNLDGQQHTLVGAKGNCKIMLDSQGIPYIEFEFTGLYVAPSSVAALATTGYSSYQVPTPVTYANSTVATLFGQSFVWKKLELDVGNQVEHFDNPGEEFVDITDRNSKGTFTGLLVAYSTFNPITNAKANTTGALSVTHGTVDALKVHITAPAVQLVQPKIGDDRQRATLESGLSFTPTSANDDEWKIRFAAAAS